MADTCKLKVEFKDAGGQVISSTFNYADKTAGASVRPLMEGMIANSAIYNPAPVTLVAAKFIETTETPVSL